MQSTAFLLLATAHAHIIHLLLHNALHPTSFHIASVPPLMSIGMLRGGGELAVGSKKVSDSYAILNGQMHSFHEISSFDKKQPSASSLKRCH